MTPDSLRNVLITASANPGYGTVDIYVATMSSTGRAKCKPEPLMFSECDPGERIEPLLRVSPEEAQILANALWDAGIRPTSAAGSAGQASAMQAHIGDLRTVVTALLPRSSP